jgi:uncharacterized protein
MADPFGRSPLHHAVVDGDDQAIEALLAHGADPDLQDHDGFSPLHAAAQRSNVVATRTLLEHGARVDPRNKFGNTPLHFAFFNSRAVYCGGMTAPDVVRLRPRTSATTSPSPRVTVTS